MDKNIVQAEPYLKSSIVPDAKRYPKSSYLRRCDEPYALWRDILNPLVLQKTAFKVVIAKESSIFSENQLLSPRRDGAGNHLCLNRGHLPVKQNGNHARQRSFSTNCWLSAISLCQQFKTFFKTHGCAMYPSHQQGSRQPAFKNVLSAQTTHKPTVRYRFIRIDHLRQEYRRSQSRIQSAQTRRPFLSSLVLLRSAYQRLLAWCIEARGCLHSRRLPGIFQRMPWKNTTLHISPARAGRFRILRSRIHRIPRREEYRIRRSGQDDPCHSAQSRGPALSIFPQGLGGSRIRVYAYELEKTSPFYCYSPAVTGKRFQPIAIIHATALCLPGLCHQFAFGPSEHLVFLPGQGGHRSAYQRAQRKLRLGQNTHKFFFGQSNLFLPIVIRVQSRQLVQKNMFAERISELNITDNSHRTVSVARPFSQTRQPACSQSAQQLYLQEKFRGYYSQN